jgi:hypothetical protein
LEHRRDYLKDVVSPLQDKVETLYVVPGSDAETHAAKRFPHKKTKHVRNGIRPTSIARFLRYLPHLFQRHRAEGLSATYQFTFTGEEPAEATVEIRDKTCRVHPGHVGQPDLAVFADSKTWVGFLRREQSLVWVLLTRKVRLQGSPRLLLAFGKCFPS